MYARPVVGQDEGRENEGRLLYARECLSYVLCGSEGTVAMRWRGVRVMLRDELMRMGEAQSEEVHPRDQCSS